eukprot:5580711-Prorocentrum_lima.AAC.1
MERHAQLWIRLSCCMLSRQNSASSFQLLAYEAELRVQHPVDSFDPELGIHILWVPSTLLSAQL